MIEVAAIIRSARPTDIARVRPIENEFCRILGATFVELQNLISFSNSSISSIFLRLLDNQCVEFGTTQAGHEELAAILNQPGMDGCPCRSLHGCGTNDGVEQERHRSAYFGIP